MTKILIEIDTDTQRVVPVSRLTVRELPPLYADEGRQEQVNSFHYYSGWNDLVSILTAAPQPEPVDADLRRDAERWRKMATLMFIGNVELNQDEDGGYSISVDPVENILGKTWCGNSPDEAIDFVQDLSQGEQK